MSTEESNPWACTDPLMKGSIWAGADDRISMIRESTDVKWLVLVLAHRDNQLTVRQAAERRLRALTKQRHTAR